MTRRILDLHDGLIALTRFSQGRDRGHALQLDLRHDYVVLSVDDCAALSNALAAFVHEQRSHTVVAYPATLTIERVQQVNRVRADRWHNGDFRQWSILEWAGAMCGEAGEAANIAKKMRRRELNLSGNESSEHAAADAFLGDRLARECADTFLYLCLVAESGYVNLSDAVRSAFNAKSDEMGYPERL